MPSFVDRLQHAWNAFMNKDPTRTYANTSLGVGSYIRPDRPRLTSGNDRSIVTAIYNRIAVDCSMIDIKHCELDENKRFLKEIDSTLNDCFTVEANMDQTFRAFMRDVVLRLLDEGCVALVPVITDVSPLKNETFKIGALRAADIIQWYPKHIRIRIYNELTGKKEEMDIPKRMAAIVTNPFFVVMNEPNSTAKRLMRKLALLDTVDEQNSSGKLDLIIQLPYVIRNEARRQQAEERRKDIEVQLSQGKYGIAYTDGTEKVTQLNRPVENQLLTQIDNLTKTLYGQLGMSEKIMDNTASENELNNYFHNCVEVIVTEIVGEMRRKFLTKTARTRGQDILFFRDIFRLVSVTQVASTADVFSRNEIMSSNEFRQVLGFKPSDDPRADELRNSNMPQDDAYYDYGMAPEQDQAMMEQDVETQSPADLPISQI